MKIFTINRNFNAPRDLIWDCWTNPEHFGKWFAPAGCTTEILHSDVKPGGYNHVRITTADGTTIYGKYTFQEIDPKNQFIYINAFADEKANVIHHPFSPTWPLELKTTVTLTEQGETTDLTLSWEPINASAEEITTFIEGLESCHQGWTGTFDNLDSYLGELA
jgi:uncharacterized protein YndB with AHSA1/START domain